MSMENSLSKNAQEAIVVSVTSRVRPDLDEYSGRVFGGMFATGIPDRSRKRTVPRPGCRYHRRTRRFDRSLR